MARLKVLISGAGVAGNALAFWLSKLGHEVSIVERFPGLRATGLQIDLRGHGIEVMRRMGLEAAFRAKSAPENGVQIVGKSGRRWAYFPANKSGKGVQSFTTEFEIMRGDLCTIMYDATKHRTNYRFGTCIDTFEEKGDAVEVRFQDGTSQRFDLLVGADGIGSRTRKMMLGSEPDAFHPLHDLYVAYFTIPRPMKEGDEYIASAYTATGRRAIMTRRSNPQDIQVYLTCRTDSGALKNARHGDVATEKAAFKEIFRGAGWETEEILNSLDDVTDFYCERMGLVKLPSWFRGPVALVGDAAYCPSANTGMGTTSAIVGAYILAGEIGRHCDQENGLATALKAYEQKFQPFMAQVQKGVLEDDGSMMPSTPLGIAVMNGLLGVASLLKINIIGDFILREKVKGWKLPEYEELARCDQDVLITA